MLTPMRLATSVTATPFPMAISASLNFKMMSSAEYFFRAMTAPPLSTSVLYQTGARFGEPLTNGFAGFHAQSFLRKGTVFNGDALFIIRDVPPEGIEALNELLTDFKSIADRTCVSTTCRHLIESNLAVMDQKVLTPSALVNRLTDYKKANDSAVDVYTLKNGNLARIQNALRFRAGMIGCSLGLGAVTFGIPLVLIPCTSL